jgi:hypothetical protein
VGVGVFVGAGFEGCDVGVGVGEAELFELFEFVGVGVGVGVGVDCVAVGKDIFPAVRVAVGVGCVAVGVGCDTVGVGVDSIDFPRTFSSGLLELVFAVSDAYPGGTIIKSAITTRSDKAVFCLKSEITIFWIDKNLLIINFVSCIARAGSFCP